MTKAERYLQIAARYLPEGVVLVPVEGTGYRGRANLHEEYDEEGNELPRRMEAPIPNTLGRLWIYLHECAHFRLNHNRLTQYSNDYSRGEAEANLEVMRIFDEEGSLLHSVFSSPNRILSSPK